jgi:hypothetical protein
LRLIHLHKKTNIYVFSCTEPNEIADAVIFLLSDYSQMVNGLNLYVDGGYMTGWVYYINKLNLKNNEKFTYSYTSNYFIVINCWNYNHLINTV